MLSEAEKQKLINLILERWSILLSRELDITEKNTAWEEVAHLFNSDKSTPVATTEQLKESWDHVMKTCV